MTSTERIKYLQGLVGAYPDGIIGKETLTKFGLKYDKTPVQVVHFFAQIHHESGGFAIGRENMNYTTSGRIMAIFGTGVHSAKITSDQAKVLVRKPQKLANRVYGILNPNKARELGNTGVNDGWLYRGGGALQCTGKADYMRYGGEDLVNNPDLITESAYYFSTAIKEFDARRTWGLCRDLSESSLLAVTKRVNGGTNGLADRRAKLNYYRKIMGI